MVYCDLETIMAFVKYSDDFHPFDAFRMAMLTAKQYFDRKNVKKWLFLSKH